MPPKSVTGNQNADGLSTDVPDFKEISHGDSAALVSEAQGENPMEWALDILKKREQAHVLQREESYCGELLRKV